MLDRYSTPRMRAVWSAERKWSLFLEVELAWLTALEEDGIAPRGNAEIIRNLVKIDPARIEELEARIKHDIIAFLAHVEEQAGDATRFLHYGLTSYDINDTVLALQFKEASSYIQEQLSELACGLETLSERHLHTPYIGRTHGIHAEVTSFGLAVASWREAVIRSIRRIDAATSDIVVGKFSGAVGNAAFSDPSREERVLRRLGLGVEPIATQVVARDRHAAFFASLAGAAAVMEHIALNIRHLQRTEVSEVLEPFSQGQRGSSAMPHKRNPVLCENICGLARVVRAAAMAGYENVALWHERDISHSSVERMIAPDATATTEFMAARLTGIVKGLEVNTQRMESNIGLTKGLINSEALLLKLISKGLRRQEAYTLVQRAALAAIEGHESFREKLMNDQEVTSLLTPDEIEECFCVDYHLRWCDTLFERRTRL